MSENSILNKAKGVGLFLTKTLSCAIVGAITSKAAIAGIDLTTGNALTDYFINTASRNGIDISVNKDAVLELSDKVATLSSALGGAGLYVGKDMLKLFAGSPSIK